MNQSRLQKSRFSSPSKSEYFQPRQYVSYYATESQAELWKYIFDEFDRDCDGRLAPRDLIEAMEKYKGYHPRRNNIYKAMATYDKDESGNIDFRQFLRMIFEDPYENDTPQDMKQVFSELDQDDKGYLNAQDLANLAADLKESFTEEEIDIIMRKLDPKKTGKISVAAFIDFNREDIV